ncbi:MAG TPA: sigma-70 family RNA polymerase sigma factor [Anaerolineae bacterium]|nr:sigma-70 family RNA polymerase sigma factor [Anaerolineae bacterium]HQI83119.1 sigma-70 family RNA polymerase sigma factor [Anaerolineae bacterium]
MNHNFNARPDEELAHMAREGDRLAFDVLCDRYLPVVYNRLRALLPPDVVDDVTQEVFIAAMRAIGRYRATASFRTWISAIARHKVADFYRARGRQPQTVELDLDINDVAEGEGWQEQLRVRLALQRLPEQYQEVLLLRFAEGLPFQDVADALSLSLEATKSRYRRAMAAMAEALGEGGREGEGERESG